jgi:non-structural maintenance of chromosomes element 1
MFDTSNTVHEEIYAIRSTDAVNLSSSQGVALTKTAGEAAIDAFMREGWLEKSRAGFITLSPRGLLELRGYLLEMFSDEGEEGDARTDKIKSCHVCAEIVTQVYSPFSRSTLMA